MAEIHHIKCGTDNCYLVNEGENAILFDTGSAAGLEQVIAECSKYKMKLIVISHPHFDHAENAAVLSERFGIPVAVNQEDLELFENYDAQPLKSYGLVGLVVLGFSLKVLRETKVRRPENLIFVKEGDSLSEYGIDAKILELPGHTMGSIGLDVEQKHLLVADALDNWIFPATGHLFCDYAVIKKTAARIKALGARTIYYGHGKPTRQK